MTVIAFAVLIAPDRSFAQTKKDSRQDSKQAPELVKSEFLEEQFKALMLKAFKDKERQGEQVPDEKEREALLKNVSTAPIPGIFRVTREEHRRLSERKFDSAKAKERMAQQLKSALDASVDLPDILLYLEDIKGTNLTDEQLEIAAHLYELFIPPKIKSEKGAKKSVKVIQGMPPGFDETERHRWRRHILREAGYEVLCPSAVMERKLGRAKSGQEIILYYCWMGDSVCSFQHVDIPKERQSIKVQEALKLGRDGAIASTKGKLINEKEASMAGHPALEILIETPAEPKFFRGRFTIIKGRLYQLHINGSKESVQSKAADRFLDSFLLLSGDKETKKPHKN